MTQKELNKDALIRYMDFQGWHYECVADDETRYIAKLGMNIGGRLSSIRLFTEANAHTIQSVGVCPINADEASRPMVAEYITRANYGLMVGKFEMDYSDGEVRFQSCQSCTQGVPHQKDIERIVDMPIVMFHKYGDGLVKSLLGLGNPEADIREIEG